MSGSQGLGEQPRPARPKRLYVWIPLVVIAGVVAVLPVLGGAAFVALLGFSGSSNDLMSSATSPDRHWTVRAYSHDPGAMASDWVTVDVVDNTHRQATWQIAHLDDLSDPRLWVGDGNQLRMVWRADTTVAIGAHDYGVVKPWWKTTTPPVTSLIAPFLAAALVIGYWCYRIWRSKGRRRWLGFMLGFWVSLVATPFVGLACVPISYALPARNAGPGRRSHVLVGALVTVGIIITFAIAAQVVLVPG